MSVDGLSLAQAASGERFNGRTSEWLPRTVVPAMGMVEDDGYVLGEFEVALGGVLWRGPAMHHDQIGSQTDVPASHSVAGVEWHHAERLAVLGEVAGGNETA